MAHPDHDPDVGDVQVLDWTVELALRVAGVTAPAAAAATGDARAEILDKIRDAIDDDRIPPQAVDVLIERGGWTELDD